ncbi:hypothetical protein ABH892_001861 [Paenibacillus sp. RC254]|uniref:hypothetical protein n=1 Tax=unclassified Paenibacillus TaxID=185978 RepID=UPI0024BBE5B8|nr:hypothetical protein [Paenibacillus sp. RC334]
MKKQILRLCSVFSPDLELFPFFIDHYKKIGVDSFHIILHLPENMLHLIDEKLLVFREQGITPEKIYTGNWSGGITTSLINETINKYSDDWFIVADSDEFQIYPNDIKKIINSKNDNVDYISGCLLDRFAQDGDLPLINYDKSIWEQFPMCGFFAFPIADSWPYKITACKGHITLSEGSHAVIAEDHLITNEIICQVHHFKWTGSYINRTQKKLKQESNGEWEDDFYPFYGDELRRALDYLNKNNNKFNINSELFRVEYSPAPKYECYSKWNEIARMLESWDKQDREKFRDTLLQISM